MHLCRFPCGAAAAHFPFPSLPSIVSRPSPASVSDYHRPSDGPCDQETPKCRSGVFPGPPRPLRNRLFFPAACTSRLLESDGALPRSDPFAGATTRSDPDRHLGHRLAALLLRLLVLHLKRFDFDEVNVAGGLVARIARLGVIRNEVTGFEFVFLEKERVRTRQTSALIRA